MSNINTILAIDTSCDDTSVAVVRGNKVLSNVISSQVELHKEWGGVVPGLARQEHEKRIDSTVELALKEAGVEIDENGRPEIDAVAVTQGPGLAIALEVGIRKAKELALKCEVPLIPVDHMEGHLFSSLIGVENFDEKFPALGVLVSGSHTELIKVDGVGEYELLGETVDDAIGECFDKVARVLGFGYPGGPIISKRAEKGDDSVFNFPIAMKNSGDMNVSYSGLKTAVLYKVRELAGEARVQERTNTASWEKGVKPELKDYSEAQNLDEKTIADICASFQTAAIETLLNKVRGALKIYDFKTILLGGGVAQNKLLQTRLREIAEQNNIEIYIPSDRGLFMDNAAMIGFAGWLNQKNTLHKRKQIGNLDRNPSKRIAE